MVPVPLRLLAVMLALSLPPGAAAAQVAPVDDPGRLLASNCFQCHGTDGRGVRGGFEGLEAGEIADELREMAASGRFAGEEGIMRVHAQAYSPAEVATIARYIAEVCQSGCPTAPAPESVSVALQVDRTRFGDVRAEDPALDCTGRCAEARVSLPAGQALVLTAVPGANGRFLRWTGACRGRDSVCVLPLDADTQVTARFRHR